MHNAGYMHRDIKPENFLISHQKQTMNTIFNNSSQESIHESTVQPVNTQGLASDNTILKLADFGLAKEFRKHRGGNHTEYVSTRWYRAPELILRSQTYSESVDIFALGCIMAELYLGRPIFPGISESDQLTRIVTVLGTPSR